MFIEFDQVSKRFQRAGRRDESSIVAVKSVTLGVDRGEMLALVGASGSGKTTLLRCLAGLETPDDGRIRIGDRNVFSARDAIDVPIERRDVGLIFQSYALWPHLTVERNVAYPLERRKIAATERKSRVAKYLDLVDCAHLALRYPHELSGGQQQRIALARALVYEPAVVLFDEPLSNLDPSLREHLRSEIRSLQRKVGFTGVYVTHDQGEAFYVGDRIALLSQGELVQAGTTEEIYNHPCSPLVARFSGATNVTEGELAEGGTLFASRDLENVPLRARSRPGTGRQCVFMVRPESVRLVPFRPATPRATVFDRTMIGAFQEYTIELATGARWRARVDNSSARFKVGDVVSLEFDGDEAFIFDNPSQGGGDQL